MKSKQMFLISLLFLLVLPLISASSPILSSSFNDSKSNSSGDYVFYDNCEGTTYNTTLWSVNGAGYVLSGGKCVVQSSNRNTEYAHSKPFLTLNQTLDFQFTVSATNALNIGFIGLSNASATQDLYGALGSNVNAIVLTDFGGDAHLDILTSKDGDGNLNDIVGNADFSNLNTASSYNMTIHLNSTNGVCGWMNGTIIGCVQLASSTFNEYHIHFSQATNTPVYVDRIRIYNGTYAPSSESIPPPSAVPNITLTATNIYNASAINNFSVIIDGGGQLFSQSTLNGTILLVNLTSYRYNLTVFSPTQNGGYINRTYLDQYINSSTFQANLIPLYYFFSNTYSSYINYSNQNYTRNLSYSVNLSCPSEYYTSYLDVYINNSVSSSNLLTCTNASQLVTGNYQHSKEGNYTIRFLLNASYLPEQNNRQFSNGTFLSDLNSPTIAYLNFSYINGFYNSATNVSLTCNDTIAPILTNNLTFNSLQYRYENITTETNIKNNTNFQDGTNLLIGTCKDFFSSTSLARNISIYFATIYLIDEKDNTLFNVANITGARAYFDDNSTYYDFKVNNNNAVNFSSDTNNKIRFELVYSNGDIITRYIDVALIDNNIRVCANKEGVSHYQQLLISSTQQQAIMKSIFSKCYVAADYTRFAYQDALTLQAYTIATQYYLYTFDEGNQVLLASVDGSIANIINLDVLQFNRQAFNINILTDAMIFGVPLNSNGDRINNTIIIYYLNLKGDNTAATMDITRMDTGVIVLTTSSFTSPNNFTLYFDYSTLANISNTTVFKVDFTKTTSSGVSSFTRYFNINADTGVTKGSWAFAVAFLLTVFGLTLSVSRITFGWLGLVTNLASVFILATAVGSWYVNLLMMINVIIFFYIGLVMWQQNYITLT